MKNFTVNNEGLITNGAVSVDFLQDEMKAYGRSVQEVAARLLAETDLNGDLLVDELFNAVNEKELLEFTKGDVSYFLSISRSYGPIDEESEELTLENFGASYLIEHRDAASNLLGISDFTLGEETKLVEALNELGLDLNGILE